MNFWSKPSTTSILLAIIAFLLLVQVVQTASQNSKGIAPAPVMKSMSNPHGASNPHVAAPASPAMPGGGEDFDPALMVLASLKCPSDKLTTLDAPTCKGADAETRQKFVRKLMEVDRPFREVFDAIVAEYGEAALSDQALQIRRSMRGGK